MEDNNIIMNEDEVMEIGNEVIDNIQNIKEDVVPKTSNGSGTMAVIGLMGLACVGAYCIGNKFGKWIKAKYEIKKAERFARMDDIDETEIDGNVIDMNVESTDETIEE